MYVGSSVTNQLQNDGMANNYSIAVTSTVVRSFFEGRKFRRFRGFWDFHEICFTEN